MNLCFRRFFLLLASLGALPTASQAEPMRHLFLDPAYVQQSENVSLHVNSAQQREIVLRADKPWEQLMINLFLTVLDAGGEGNGDRSRYCVTGLVPVSTPPVSTPSAETVS